jgi:hypothetical protein
MTAPVSHPDSVFAVARELLALEERLARVEEERTAIQAAIAAAMGQLRKLAVDAVRPEAVASPAPPARYPVSKSTALGGVLLNYLGQNPDRVFTSNDLARDLRSTSRRVKSNIRSVLSRLSRSGLIERIGHGRYRARPLP